jgi:hypothetical protein
MSRLRIASLKPKLAEQRCLASLELQGRHGVRRDDVDALGRIEVGGIDDERGDALLGPGEHDVERRDAAVRDPGLGSGERPSGAFTLRGGRDGLHVGAGIRLRQRERGDRITARSRAEVLALLLLAACKHDRAAAEALHDEGEVGKAGVVGEHFAQRGDGAHVRRVVDAMLQVARATQVLDQAPADRVRVFPVRVPEVVDGPRLRFPGQREVSRLEERPAVVRKAVHGSPFAQSPSNTGFRFATNAS